MRKAATALEHGNVVVALVHKKANAMPDMLSLTPRKSYEDSNTLGSVGMPMPGEFRILNELGRDV